MASPLTLTIALERYDRHMPFFDGTVEVPAGLALKALQVGQTAEYRDGGDRHERMIHDRAFDVAEFSLSTYLMAKNRGVPLTAVPVFPRRLFSASQMFVHPLSNLWQPKDLIGKKVALSSFQTTLSLLAKGDLKFEYGVPWEEIHWFVSTDEKVKFEPKKGVKIDRLPKGADLGLLLADRTIDAFFLPHPPHSVMSGKTKARRLFADTPQEEARYFDKYGWFPIMHVLAIQEDVVKREPWVAKALMQAYASAKEISESYYEDPNWSRLVWGRHYYEQERDLLPGDPWPIGFKANKANLEQFIRYSHDQGLISEAYGPERLFVGETLDT
ncbi:MAG TPA: 4,5-dihydroxyphthalate decarboxylase [Alphaproteobacteria bacterium]|jgi:4,5-dihydroxyphthalate decarboxylase|nr:4,5-dihydroxyphthalate decarboxylase [Alphaproteobacteria bacterium]